MQLLSEGGLLCRSDAARLIMEHVCRGGGTAEEGKLTPWHGMPTSPAAFLEHANDTTRIGGPAVEACVSQFVAAVSSRHATPLIDSMIRASLNPGRDAATGATGGSVLNDPLLGPVLSGSESVATVGLVDADLCSKGLPHNHIINGTAGDAGDAGSGGMLLCPGHVLRSYLDVFAHTDFVDGSNGGAPLLRSPLSAHNANASPSRRRIPGSILTPLYSSQAGGRSSSVASPADVTVGFEFRSLTPKLLSIAAPLISHWIIIGSRDACASVARVVARDISALRVAGAPAVAAADMDMSFLVTSTASMKDRDITADDNGSIQDVAASCRALVASPPVVLQLSNGGTLVAGSYGASVGSLLEGLRAVVPRTRSLRVAPHAASSVAALPLRGLCAYLELVAAPGGAEVLSSASALQCLHAASRSWCMEFYKWCLAEALQLLAKDSALAAYFSSIDQVDALLRRSVRALCVDLCGGKCSTGESPVMTALNEPLEDAMNTHFTALSSDLKSEAFHMAQSSASGVMRPLALRYGMSADGEASSSEAAAAGGGDVLTWTHAFMEASHQFLQTPLLRSGDALREENVLTRAWAAAAKRSALTDIVMQWFLPNTEALLQAEQARQQTLAKKRDELTVAAQQRIADFEARMQASSAKQQRMQDHIQALQKTCDDLHTLHNDLKDKLMKSFTSHAARLQQIRGARAQRKFISDNASADTSSSSSSGEDGDVADHVAEHELEPVVTGLLSDVVGFLHALGAPTHGLIRLDGVEHPPPALAARSKNHLRVPVPVITARQQQQLHPGGASNSSLMLNTSKASAFVAISANASLLTNGSRTVTPSHAASEVASARQAALAEADAARAASRSVLMVSAPPSPISPTLASGRMSQPLLLELPVTTTSADDADDLERREARVQASMAAVVELQQRGTVLREQLNAAQHQRRVLEEQLRERIMEVSAVRDECASLLRKVESLTSDVASVQREVEEEASAHNVTKADLQRTVDDLRHQRGLYDATRIAMDELEKRLEAAETGQRQTRSELGADVDNLTHELREAQRRIELLTVEVAMHESNAKQFQSHSVQLERALLQERQERREQAQRHEQHAEELMAKLDEVMSRGHSEIKAMNAQHSAIIDKTSRELNLAIEERDALRGRVAALEELNKDLTGRVQSQDEALRTATEELERLRTEVPRVKDALQAAEMKRKMAVEEIRQRDYQLAQLREELRGSKEARRALTHSMEALEMLIQEQKCIGTGTISEIGADVTAPSWSSAPLPPPLPPAMSIIRAVAAESPQLHRSAAHDPSLIQPLPQVRPLNVSTASSRPVNLHELLAQQSLDQSRWEESATDEQHDRLPYQTTLLPISIPAARHSTVPGPRPLGPHLKALSAIEALLQ